MSDSDEFLTHGFENLRLAVLRLSEPASNQLEYLSKLSVHDSAEELALEFSDFYVPIRWRIVERDSHHSWLERMDVLDALLDKMSGIGGDLWTSQALENSPYWNQVRELAKKALQEFPKEL